MGSVAVNASPFIMKISVIRDFTANVSEGPVVSIFRVLQFVLSERKHVPKLPE
jgi:hypothetical protein